MSDKVVKLIEDVKALTVLELSELVKALEEEFGVSAAAPVAVAAAPVAGAAPAAEAVLLYVDDKGHPFLSFGISISSLFSKCIFAHTRTHSIQAMTFPCTSKVWPPLLNYCKGKFQKNGG